MSESSKFSSNPIGIGICHLVGAGPGDPGLLTVLGRHLIADAEVIIYDALCNPQLLENARADAVLVYAGKRAGHHTLSQEEINTLLVRLARSGKTVVRLKGGDPFVFGRGGEEAQALRAAGVPFTIVPGISSAIAGPAYAGIPVTQRGVATAFTVVTGHQDPDLAESAPMDYAGLIRSGGTLVLLMGVERLEAITRQMLAGGAPPELPVALVRWATTPQQETLSGTLEDIAERAAEVKFEAPAVAVFGPVAALREELAWFEAPRPLLGKRVVVTRSRRQASHLAGQLKALGADVLELPTIRIEPSPRPEEFAELVREAHTYDWLIFTSANGAAAFFEQFYRTFKDAREIGGVRIAAIGAATAAKIAEYRFQVDLQPEEAVAESLVKALAEYTDVENLKVLLIRAEGGRDVIFQQLSDKGAIVDLAIAYRTVPETEDRNGARRRLREEGADVITFTSSSSVTNFLALKLPLPAGVKIASIGPITSSALLKAGLAVDIEARRHDMAGLVEAIATHFSAQAKAPHVS